MPQKLYKGFILNSYNNSMSWVLIIVSTLTTLQKSPNHQVTEPEIEPRQYGSRIMLLFTSLSSLSRRAGNYFNSLLITIGSHKVHWRGLQRSNTNSSFHSWGLIKVKSWLVEEAELQWSEAALYNPHSEKAKKVSVRQWKL